MSRLRAAWPYAMAVAAPLVLFAPFLLGLRVLYWGTVEFQFYPWQHLAVEALRSGHLPLWDPLLGNGAPLLANYQTAALYPPNWLALLLPLETAQAWLAALHLAWAGAGMVALARRLHVAALGQAVAGLAFGLSQYLVARVSFLSINATVAWLPWIILLLEVQLQLGERQAPRAPRAGAALALSACAALQLLAGHAQTTWYTLLLGGGWCAWRLLGWRGAPAAARARTALWLAGPLAVGALLAGVQLLPTAELLQQSPRATAASYDFVMTYSFSPWRLLTLAAPDLLGNPARGQYFGYGNYWEDAIYVGMLPLLLGLGGAVTGLTGAVRRLVGAWAHPSRGAGAEQGAAQEDGPAGLDYFLIGVALVSLILGLGQNTPVFPFLYWHVPTFNLFQAPTRMMIWLVFALALLAGRGAARWRAPQGRALYWTRLGAAGAAAMGGVGLAAWLTTSAATQVGLQVQTMGRALALAGLTAFVAAILSLVHPADGAPGAATGQAAIGHGARWGLTAAAQARLWMALVVAFVALDLLTADYGLNPGAPPDVYQRPPATAQAIGPIAQGHRVFYYPDDEYTVRYGTFVSFKEFGPPSLAYGARESLLSDLSALDGVASANNFDPLVSARYAGLMNVISNTRSLSLLRLVDVALVASAVPHNFELPAYSGPGGLSYYRVPGTPQRVWIVSAATTVAGMPEALAALADPKFDPAQAVILEASDANAAATGWSGSPSHNALMIPVVLDRDGWVVLANTSYPGWQATLDGRPAPIRHADVAFQAVAVPAGAHRLVFDYHPDSLRDGWLLTALGGVCFLALAVWSVAGQMTQNRKDR
jgi:hypothetical protein